jgi:hypothetical protein
LLNWTVWNGCNDRLQSILEYNGNKNNIKNKKMVIIMTNHDDDDDDDDGQQQTIRCPNCRKQIKIDELYEYVNTKPESKREAIEQEIEIWGLTSYYDRQYYEQNIVICPSCARISHLSDWLEVSSRSRNGSKK